ncbi:MAG TPA: hypothetical protein VJK72_00705 [Candidatus Nanoarchaeia archaeon]|nr:hypothetical protein [Candidatus Nanoarchaeia archaeon]
MDVIIMNERSDIFIALLLIGIFVVIALPSAYVIQGTLTGLSISETMMQYAPDVPILLGAAMLVLLLMTIMYRFSGVEEGHLKFVEVAERNEKMNEAPLKAKRLSKKEKKKLHFKKEVVVKVVKPIPIKNKAPEEKRELPLPPQMLNNFIKTSLKNGASSDDIQRVLLGKGWPRSQVENIVSKIKKSKKVEAVSYDHELPMIEKELQKLSQVKRL